MTPKHWSDFQKYLTADHLAGGRATYTIASVKLEEVHGAAGEAENKPVLYFAELAQGLVLSPINQKTLRTLFGDDVDACLGKRISLDAKPLRVAGRVTRPVRIVDSPDGPSSAVAPAPMGFPGRRAQPFNAAAQLPLAESAPTLSNPTLSNPTQSNPTPSRPATPPSGKAFQTWIQLSDAFVREHPAYQLSDGLADRRHILYTLAALGYPKLDADNLQAAMRALSDHANKTEDQAA